MKNILSICINYHDEENTIKFVKDFLNQKGTENLEIIIVDNSKGKNIHSKLIKISGLDERIAIYKSEKNLGYFGGAKFGLKKYLERKKLPEWIIISNTDINFPDKNFCKKLFKIEAKNDVGVYGPKIISSNTLVNQNPHLVKKPSFKKMYLQKILYTIYITYAICFYISILKKMINAFLKRKKKEDCDSKYIYAPHGSFIIFNRKYFVSGGDIDYEGFMFWEEMFVAESAIKAGLKIKYEPSLKVFHNEHSTTGNYPKYSKFYFIKKSITYCYEKYFKNENRS